MTNECEAMSKILDAVPSTSCLPSADPGHSHTINIIDLESVPFDSSCADFLYDCVHLDIPDSSLIDNECSLSDPLSLCCQFH